MWRPRFEFLIELLGTKVALIKRVRSMGKWEYISPSPVVVHGMPRSLRISYSIWNNAFMLRPNFEEVKVTIATMYLISDAKLWWSTKYEDIMVGRHNWFLGRPKDRVEDPILPWECGVHGKVPIDPLETNQHYLGVCKEVFSFNVGHSIHVRKG